MATLAAETARESHAGVPAVCLLPAGLPRRGIRSQWRREPFGCGRATWLREDRLARAAGRGHEDAAPALLHFGVLGAVALLVLVILVVSMVLWAILR